MKIILFLAALALGTVTFTPSKGVQRATTGGEIPASRSHVFHKAVDVSNLDEAIWRQIEKGRPPRQTDDN